MGFLAGLRSPMVLLSLLTFTALFASINVGAQSANGHNVRIVTFADFNGRTLGQFVQQRGGWVETGKRGGARFRFRELNRDDWSVYLQDDSRGVFIQLDLHTRRVNYRDTGALRHLYNIVSAEAAQQRRRGASCYWMDSRAPHNWLGRSEHDRNACYAQDSCDGGLGRSGGGCYKWADCPTCKRYPWSNTRRAAPAPASQGRLDTNFYYRLSTQFRGDKQCLDVFNGGDRNNLTHLANCANYSGQFWRLTPAGDGNYKLSTSFRGQGMCLDIFNGGARNNQPYLTDCANFSGQFWQLRSEGDWYRLSTQFRGSGRCLDIFNGGQSNNMPHLDNCANYSGQLWKFSRTNRRVQ